MRSRRVVIVLVGVVAIALPSGCGEEDVPEDLTVDRTEEPAPARTQSRTVRDPRGDVETHPRAEEPGVSREQLDLTSLKLTRRPSGLTATFGTASPPGGAMVQVLEVYDRRRLVQAAVEIRYEGGEPRAVHRPPGGRFEPIAVDVSGRSAAVRMPPNRYTRERVFKWRAYAASTRPAREVRDRIPSGAGATGFFPEDGS